MTEIFFHIVFVPTILALLSAGVHGGGVIGINGTLPFIDGGFLNKPEFSRFAPNGDWGN
ncbi:MAG: hypothetical protein WDM71_06210 [Ferruginibacter sp.]